ncbi:Outer membrane protein A precursor [Paraburkholderia tropica]|uniref:OmpA family protein n=1 Tax=Paraburkholderia tropica TaxID=92647 RepID=UPI001CAB5648|nr:OmpA family protein [Paraburkholderia tropica]CAG9238574.1 Outer membrane protein A precursor [Paraburkholderia tropica]
MKNISIAAQIVALATTAMIAGCAAPQNPPRFPDQHAASPAGGTFVNAANLRNMGIGLNKDQVRDLIGPPHFNEWFVGNHVWNYLFDFHRGDEIVSCQYQVQFDRHMQVSATFWRDPACAAWVSGAAAEPVAAPVVQKDATVDEFSLQTDALFAFGKSDLGSLQPEGRKALDGAVARIGKHQAVSAVRVVGHTDRIGADSLNQRLSLARANTVRDYLLAHGVHADVIHAEGVGASQSVTHCPAGEGRAVIACLKPDRRVTIAVTAQH